MFIGGVHICTQKNEVGSLIDFSLSLNKILYLRGVLK